MDYIRIKTVKLLFSIPRFKNWENEWKLGFVVIQNVVVFVFEKRIWENNRNKNY